VARTETWVKIAERERKALGWSQDDLAYEARSHGGPRGLNSSWLSKVKLGQRPATLEFLRGIAGALGIEAERFVEYRLAKARQILDEREVGLEQAVANLTALEGLVVGEEGLPDPPGELARLLRGASPSSPDQQRSGSEGRSASARRRRAA